MSDYWAVQYLADPKLLEEIADEEFDQDEIMRLMEEHPDDWMNMV